MLNDPRTRAKLRDFFLQWLRVDQGPDLAKDPQKFPEFGPEIGTDLRASLEVFLDEVVWSESSDFRSLLLADTLPINQRLANFYGVKLPEDATATNSTFTSIPFDAPHRAGVLTHPYLLASFAYTSDSSPIHRGVMISRSLLGRALRPPPEAVSPLAADLHANLTTRERVAFQTKSEACIVCHGMINPLGFTLENFDAVGRFRDKDRGKPVDSRGEYLARDGKTVKFGSVRDLAKFLSESDETHAAFVSQLFHHMVKQPIRAYQPELQTELQKSFEKSGCNMRKLAAQIVASSALTAARPNTNQQANIAAGK
jgi:hypothetical protein